MKNKAKLTFGGGLFLLSLIVVGILDLFGGLIKIEDSLIDIRHRMVNPNHKFTDKVIVLDIDEQSLETYKAEPLFGRWPWRRAIYGPILKYIAAGGAKLILFDIMFFEQSSSCNLDDDTQLALATAEAGIVSHAVNFRTDEMTEEEKKIYAPPAYVLSQAYPVEKPENLKLKGFNRINYPVESILQAMPKLHSVFYAQDEGVARYYLPFHKYEDKYFPTLSTQIYRAFHPVEKADADWNSLNLYSQGKELNIPLVNGKYRIHYYPEKTIDDPSLRISISGVIDSIRSLETKEVTDPEKTKVPLSRFKDKVVLIGVSAASGFDIRTTPYGDKPGFLYHAITASNFLEKHFMKIPPGFLGYLIVAVSVGICLALSLFSAGTITRIAVPLAVFIAYPVIAFLVFKMDFMAPLAGFAVAYPLAFLGSQAYLSFTEGAEKRKYSKVLSNMVDPTIVGEALEDLEALKKGGEKEITAFFSDVAGFSTISEQLTSADLASLLNEYLSAMTIILKQNRGTLDKYIGDAIVGIFGAPIDRPEHFMDAARASLMMIERLNEQRKFWKETNAYVPDAQQMDVRIGLNSGIAKVGFMGTDTLASYTMMGDTVNLAARLEAAGKDYGVNILISESTNKKVSSEMFTRELDAVRVKGKNEPVRIYELIATKSGVLSHIKESSEMYEAAFQLYLKQDWNKAISLFQESKKVRAKKDKAVDQLVERCEYYLKNPPGDDWDGVFTRTHK
ncbi:MAG TPA: adenylate/guanylate cyclase domain-containing protein [Leptospiraceae bacterium]|nr:adenylate/guanylate cyclase domain-containing protein [Leptospiraceae bacterium]HNF24494.1 adenylate/guanylate cyclase domain-containing protein [Leptospiraceae bacterium]HNM03485.1 adenylate/guanylate cyclase domain-containing protein [Leptospiraceae bacterium]HNN04196.1 adenylate/guanylate cyclase domain-containing protein [Leptospiraceae bacterium]HNO24044.1 adenylate/guanylate cyclase domain-containing protein [Leptospiraceae bacterium]